MYFELRDCHFARLSTISPRKLCKLRSFEFKIQGSEQLFRFLSTVVPFNSLVGIFTFERKRKRHRDTERKR